jgi:hypothetical protein
MVLLSTTGRLTHDLQSCDQLHFGRDDPIMARRCMLCMHVRAAAAPELEKTDEGVLCCEWCRVVLC